MRKYTPLRDFLRAQTANEVPMTFDEIEDLITAKLPPSARRHRAWWSNNPNNSSVTKAWLEAGFRSTQVDMASARLVFRRTGTAPLLSEADHKYLADKSSAPARHPLFGWLKGTVRVAPGVDLTEPADPEWADSLDR